MPFRDHKTKNVPRPQAHPGGEVLPIPHPFGAWIRFVPPTLNLRWRHCFRQKVAAFLSLHSFTWKLFVDNIVMYLRLQCNWFHHSSHYLSSVLFAGGVSESTCDLTCEDFVSYTYICSYEWVVFRCTLCSKSITCIGVRVWRLSGREFFLGGGGITKFLGQQPAAENEK